VNRAGLDDLVDCVMAATQVFALHEPTQARTASLPKDLARDVFADASIESAAGIGPWPLATMDQSERTAVNVVRLVEVLVEPCGGQPGDLLERPGFGEQMGRARDHLEPGRSGQFSASFLVGRQHPRVSVADDEQRRDPHPTQHVAGEIRPPPRDTTARTDSSRASASNAAAAPTTGRSGTPRDPVRTPPA
jgi:hypothetical protein